MENHQDLEDSGEEESTNPLLPSSELDPVSKSDTSQGQSTLKSCLASEFRFPKNKRKRGHRRAGSGGWSRQCPGYCVVPLVLQPIAVLTWIRQIIEAELFDHSSIVADNEGTFFYPMLIDIDDWISATVSSLLGRGFSVGLIVQVIL
ncbi:unnamed protein product, partial [Ilex paraguariensis]